MAKICPSLCVRVPVPHMHQTYLHPGNQGSEKIHTNHLTWVVKPTADVLAPGGRQSLAVYSPVPWFVQDSLEDYIFQLPLQLGWIMDSGFWMMDYGGHDVMSRPDHKQQQQYLILCHFPHLWAKCRRTTLRSQVVDSSLGPQITS